MNTTKFHLLLIVMLLLTACATSTSTFDANTADFSTAEEDNLCSVYGFRWPRSQEAKAELIRRNTFTEREWQMIEARKIEPGLSECGVKAAYQLNVAMYYFHNDVNDNPIGKDMVFSCNEATVPYCPFTKVEIREGKVSAVVPVSEP
ncbi:hypothetical protein [Methylobacter tundripaludum]|uniref:hypothetical protein n=1 Tax=Methylobacter tundripaludum TaxID=173365 RepID=UPI0004DF854B|nr:hypothetical protein [Methylobacter tundripaludum]